LQLSLTTAVLLSDDGINVTDQRNGAGLAMQIILGRLTSGRKAYFWRLPV